LSDSGPAGRAGVPADSKAPGRARGAWGDSHSLPRGTRIGRYEIAEVLGEGSFGVTYHARDLELRRDVALKEYLPAGFALRRADGTVLARSTQVAETFLWGRERFADEARTLARLEKAAGIVNVYDIISANGTAYMVMEFVQGETLEARLRREGRLHQPAVERMCFPLLDGLEQVHRAGFLHRDIKPANILLDPSGLPTLIDFGASRAALQGRTQTMTAVYTPGYAAFEQLTSAKQGPWTDIYGLGATLYHCITGNQPPSAADRMREDAMVPAMEAGKGRYATSLLGAVDAALKLRERERPQSIADWRQLMVSTGPFGHAAAAGPGTPGRVSGNVQHAGGRPAIRWRLWSAVAAVVVLLAVGGAYVIPLVDGMIQAARESEQRAAAQRAAEEAAARRRTEDEARRRAAADAEARRSQEEATRRAAAEAEARRRAEEERRRNASFPFDGTWSGTISCTPKSPENDTRFAVTVASGRGEWSDSRVNGVRIVITQDRGRMKFSARWKALAYDMTGETIVTATTGDRLDGSLVTKEWWPSEPPKCTFAMQKR